MNFFERLMQSLRRFFYGRYGGDTFNIFLLVLSFLFLYIPYVRLLSYPILGYALFRTFSRNTDKRRAEQAWFQKNIGRHIGKVFRIVKNVTMSIVNWFKRKKSLYKTVQAQKKDYVFFKCKKCGNMLRVPKNKGKLRITCPVCKTVSEKKT